MTHATKVRARFIFATVLALTLTGVTFGGEEPPTLDAAGETLSLDFTEAPLREVFEAIATAGGLKLRYDEKFDPGAKATVQLSGISVLNALRFVARSNEQFFVIRDPQTVLIAPDTRQKRQEHTPEGMRTFTLQHADPSAVITVLRSLLQTRQLVQDERLNSVKMQDTFGQLDLAEKLIERLDREKVDSSTDREPLWVGADFSHGIRSKGDALPRLEVDTDKKITLELADATVRQVYEALSEASRIQLLLHRRIDPGGAASVDLHDVSVQQALDHVNEQLGLFSVVWGPRTMLVAPDTRTGRMTQEHVGIQFFYLSHADTRTVVTALRSLLQIRQLAEIRHLNAVAIRDTMSGLQAAQEVVEEADRPGVPVARGGAGE